MNALLLLLLAQFEAPPITVVKPGAGYMVADGVSEIPLEVVLNGGGEINSAKIKASAGSVGRTNVITGNRVRFSYKVPKSTETVEEILDINLRLANGNTTSTIYTLVIEAPQPLKVSLAVKPDVFDAESPEIVSLTANASGQNLEGLSIFADKGEVLNETTTGDPSELSTTAQLTPPDLPPDAPSHLTLVAVASSAFGYGIASGGVSARAPVRLSVEIAPDSTLVVEGAENKTEPVIAPADGRTVMDGVVVRYGSRVNAFVIEDGEKDPLSVVLPVGQVSPGVVAPIPGQTVADGGTGPSLVVVVPPSATGGKIFWPDLAIEGAKLVKTIDAAENAKVLVLQRPVEVGRVTVTLDEVAAGSIEFTSSRGVAVAIEPAPTQNDERAAAVVLVKDARGEPTDLPVPRMRASSGVNLTPARIGPGQYRAALPPGSEGKPGDQVEVTAELPPAPVIAGDQLELVAASTKLTLEGPPPAMKAEATEPEVKVEEELEPETEDVELGIGIAAAGLIGASFAQALMVGGGLQLELRFPFWQQRLGARTGVEFVHHSSSGNVQFGAGTVGVKTRIAGFLIPLEIIFAYVVTESFEATIRAGGDVRFERGALTVEGDTAGGTSRVGFSARFGLDAILKLAVGRITLGVTLAGLGATADGFSTEPALGLKGSLLGMRADLSYGFWF